MICLPEKCDLKELSELISVSVFESIEANKVDLDRIENSAIKASSDFLHGDSDGVHLIFRDDDKVKGVVLVKDYWNMVSLFVLPDSHRQGIATLLVSKALEICRIKSPKGLVALNSSTYASSFYRQYGFQRKGDARDLPGGCIPYVFHFK